MNAFTGQETTAFYVRVPDQCLPLALEILSGIVWSPAIRLDEFDAAYDVFSRAAETGALKVLLRNQVG